MKNLLKMGLIRLYKNIYYLGGCVLAVGITYWFLTVQPIPQLVKFGTNSSAILVSAAIVFFFAIFTGLFFGSEREDGTFRNKVMAGHSQVTIYFSQYITLLIAMLGMVLCWIIGALAAGATLNGELLVYIVIAILYNAAFIAIALGITFRTKKQLNGIIIPLAITYFFTFGVMVGNFIYMITIENVVVNTVVKVIYNMSAIGQCFARSGLSDEGLGSAVIQIPVSLAIIALAIFAGTVKVAKRDVN